MFYLSFDRYNIVDRYDLQGAAAVQLEDTGELIEKIRAQFSGKKFSDSATLIRRDPSR